MICAPFYCLCSLDDRAPPCPVEEAPAKSLEFFRLWYLYTRHFFPREHIYLVDCAGPIPLECAFPLIDEPVDILPSESATTLNPFVGFHIKRFTQRLPHYEGSARTTLDYLLTCRANREPMFAIETDALVGYDLSVDLPDRDFVTQRIVRLENRPIQGTIHEGAITYVSLAHVERAFQSGGMERYVSGRDGDLHESALFNLFAYGRAAEWSWPHDYVHKPRRRQLARFLRGHPIGAREVDEMAGRLERDIRENPTEREREEMRDESIPILSAP